MLRYDFEEQLGLEIHPCQSDTKLCIVKRKTSIYYIWFDLHYRKLKPQLQLVFMMDFSSGFCFMFKICIRFLSCAVTMASNKLHLLKHLAKFAFILEKFLTNTDSRKHMDLCKICHSLQHKDANSLHKILE